MRSSFPHTHLPYTLLLNAVLQTPVFHTVFPPETNLSKNRTKASLHIQNRNPTSRCWHELHLEPIHFNNDKGRQKTSNYTKEFIPKVVIKIYIFYKMHLANIGKIIHSFKVSG